MARTALTVQDIAIAGTTPAYTAFNVDGHNLPATGRHFVHIKNGSGVSVTVTVTTPATLDGRAVADDTVTIAAGAEKMIGPLSARLHGQDGGADDGDAYVGCTPVTTVTVAAFQL